MVAEFAYAETENGDRIVDPSEDALFMLIDGLEHPDNTFVTIVSADGNPGLVRRRGAARRRHL